MKTQLAAALALAAVAVFPAFTEDLSQAPKAGKVEILKSLSFIIDVYPRILLLVTII